MSPLRDATTWQTTFVASSARVIPASAAALTVSNRRSTALSGGVRVLAVGSTRRLENPKNSMSHLILPGPWNEATGAKR